MPKRVRGKADEQLLLAIACGASTEAAAQKAGMSRATANRRLNDPEFKRRLQKLRQEMVSRTADGLTAAGMESVRTLLELQKAAIPYATRLGAARSVLEIGMKAREMVSLEARIAALEQHSGLQT